MTLVRGVDVSSWQHADNKPIDWEQVKAAGISFALVKATQGTSYVTPWLAEDLDSAAMAGVLTGAYHFYEIGPEPDAQAEHFIGSLIGHILDMGVWLDWEVTGANVYSDSADAAAFIAKVTETRKPCGLYTTPDFYERLKGANLQVARWWAADWDAPTAPPGAFLWQTGQETIPGIEGSVDADRLIATHGIDIPTSPVKPKAAEAPVRPAETPKVEEVESSAPATGEAPVVTEAVAAPDPEPSAPQTEPAAT